MELRCSDEDLARRDIPSFIEPRPPLILNPFMRPRPQRGINLMDQFEEDETENEEPELVQVFLRMKPCDVPNNLYEVRSDKSLVTSLDTTTAGHGRRTQHNVSRMYTFSRIFNSDCDQREVFDVVVKNNLKKLVEGHSFTLLTYGASGSGKTYTLMGTVNSPGLIPRSLEYVFKLVDAAQMPMFKPSDSGADQLEYAHQEFELQWVKRLRQVSAPLRDKYRRMSAQLRNDLTVSNVDLTNRTKYYVWVSFVEIYNEAIYDLLAPPDKRVKMRIREDASGNVYVKGVTQAFVRSGEEAYDVMVAGKHNLVVAATGVHKQSSRSHCIFTITMLTDNEGSISSSSVRLCDLAGCERARATRNTGARMQESRAINSSLHVLERCLHMLRRNQKLLKDSHLVPYRESKLTRLLGSGLSGSRGEAVSMVVTLNPSPQYAHETKHVLSLAAVAQDIQVNNTMYASTLATLESSTQDTTIYSNAEIMKLRADNERLHFELAQAHTRNKELLGSMAETRQQTADTMREIVEETKDMMRQYYEREIQSLKASMDEMVEEYESKLAAVAPASPEQNTTVRHLKNKVKRLMTEITVLENQISEERLARARAEKEVQHLRHCIEERDEKASYSHNDVLTVSDSETDEESDPFNESLEPVFRKDRRSQVVHLDKVSKHVNTSKVSKYFETLNENTGEALECDKDSSDLSGVEMNATKAAKDKCDESFQVPANLPVEDEVKKDSSSLRSHQFIEDKVSIHVDTSKVCETFDENTDPPDESLNDNGTCDVSDVVMNITNAVKDKCEEFCNLSTNLHIEDKVKKDPSSLLGRPHTENDEPQKNIVEEIVLKNGKHININRGTYFVGEPSSLSLNSLDFESNMTESQESKTKEERKPKNISKTLVNKIIKSLKISQSSDSSLTQFERHEAATSNIDNCKGKNTDLLDINILNKKKTYFADMDKIKLDDNHAVILDSMQVTREEETKEVRNANLVAKITHIVDDKETSDVSDYVTNEDKDKSDCEQLFHLSTILHDEVKKDLSYPERGTYYVDAVTSQEESTKNDVINNNKCINIKRGSYAAAEPSSLPVSSLDIEDENAGNKQSITVCKTNQDSEILVNKIIKSLKTKQYSDSSLTQFEQLEAAANNIDSFGDKTVDYVDINLVNKKKTYFNDTDKNMSSESNRLISNTVKNQEHRLYFDENDKTNSNDILISCSGTEKRTCIEDIDVEPAINKKLNDIIIHSIKDYDRSPSIVKDDIHKEYEPRSTTKKHQIENVKKPEEVLSLHKKIVKESVDIFESPQVYFAEAKEIILGRTETILKNNDVKAEENTKDIDIESSLTTKTKKICNTEIDCKSEKLHVGKHTTAIPKTDIKLKSSSSVEETPVESQGVTFDSRSDQESNKIGMANTFTSVPTMNTNEDLEENNTVNEFEKIVKDLSDVTATQFELLLTEETHTMDVKDKASKQSVDSKKYDFVQVLEQENHKSHNHIKEDSIKNIEMCEQTQAEIKSQKTKDFEEAKYNLRKKANLLKLNLFDGKKDTEVVEILAESHSKCESKNRTKRNLRLKRQKNMIDEDAPQENQSKLKDIINLKKEFSDVTMGLPAIKKEVKDIPSPEKFPEEEENQPPMMGIQSCPSKSVTRSRRKLYTPRVEPLDESPGQAEAVGDSNERIRVPRPSYHRTRARRKL